MACTLAAQYQDIHLAQGSLAEKIYTTTAISEKYNCSCNLNDNYLAHFAASDLHLSGHSVNGGLRVIEIGDHPFFLAMLFQPQLSSTAEQPHPVIYRFLELLYSG